jgi:hypothetical protein
MGNYTDLSQAFKDKIHYNYSAIIYCNGLRITGKETRYCRTAQRYILNEVVLAEWVTHKGKEYPVVYNRSNKCYASEVLWYWRYGGAWSEKARLSLKYGEIGKCPQEHQLCYKAQLMDKLIIGGAVSHILIPTSSKGDSDFFNNL